MEHNSIQTPDRITVRKAFELIKMCHDAFHGSGDIGFSGFTAESTTRSKWLAGREIDEVDSAMKTCVEHNDAIGLNSSEQ